MKTELRVVVTLFLLSAWGVSLFAATLYVPSQFATIQSGIDAASDGDTVLVASGNYSGVGNVNLDFQGKAIVLISQSGADSTIIDGMDRARGVIFNSGETETSVLQGFTIFNCRVEGENFGGGIYCLYASPIIRNNIIIENYGYLGGGIGCVGGAPLIEGNEIRENRAERGGGIACYGGCQAVIRGNYISSNFSEGG